jgi:hypothetical protein
MDVFVSWRDITYEPVRSAGSGGIGKVSVALATTGPNKGVLFAVQLFSPTSRAPQSPANGPTQEDDFAAGIYD